MDLKPQRPVRILRVKADENHIPAALPAQKSIHQRNKSSPALSTMLGAAGLKAPAKRSVFGDVSNVQRFNKEDSTAALKAGGLLNDKSIPAPLEKKVTAPRKQVSRPYSVSNLRNLIIGASAHANAEPSLKSAPTDPPADSRKTDSLPIDAPSADAILPQLNTRKTLTKEPPTKTSVDTSDPAVRHDLAQSLIAKAIAEKEKAASYAVDYIVKSTSHSNAESVSAQPTSTTMQLKTSLPPNTSIETSDKFSRQPIYDSSDVVDSALRSDGIYIDDMGKIRIYRGEQVEGERTKQLMEGAVGLAHPVLAMPQPQSAHAQSILPTAYPTVVDGLHYSQRPQPEEYWEEEDDDNYEEDDYVTARSFRSRGDTTGGATTVLFPQFTQKTNFEVEAAKLQVESERTPEEIEDESFDTSMVAEYGDEIFGYMRELEVKMLPNPHYMDNQAEIKWSMRTVLMDWVIQVHHRFNLLPETLFLTVNYIDRFLSCKVVSLGKLQLVGATAIFIAAKYEEINCPSVQEIVYMVDGGYTIDEILKAERFMLTLLQFELGWPGPMSFLRRISKADDYDLETRTLAKYFMEVTIMDEQFLGSPPSFVAAASHCLARLMLRKGKWTQQHVAYSNYTYSQLLRILPRIVECCEQPQKHHAQVYQKYSDKRFKKAAVFAEGEMVRGFVLPTSANEDPLPYTPSSYFDPSAWRHL